MEQTEHSQESSLNVLESFMDKIVRFCRKRETLIIYVILIIAAIIEMRFIQMIHLNHWNFKFMLHIDEGILHGTPPWRVFQNRLLVPFLAKLISVCCNISIKEASKIFIFILIIFQNFLMYGVMVNISGERRIGLKYSLVMSGLFLIFQDDRYILLYDYLDIVIFTYLAWLIYQKKPLIHFIILFIISLFNRESALFIPIWLIMDACIFQLRFPFVKFRLFRSLTGVGLLLSGIIFTKLIRDVFFKTSMLKEVGIDAEHSIIGNHLHLSENIHSIIWDNFFGTDIIVNIFLFCLIWFIIYSNLKLRSQDILKYSLLIVFMLLSNLVFAWITETRIFFNLIPLILILYWNLTCSASSSCK
ncbi:hypothetical protein J7K93_02450 [bacterium]|nr:hypothetical protein [bacterium]